MIPGPRNAILPWPNTNRHTTIPISAIGPNLDGQNSYPQTIPDVLLASEHMPTVECVMSLLATGRQDPVFSTYEVPF